DWKERSLKAEQKNNKPKKERSAGEAPVAEKQAGPELAPVATGIRQPPMPAAKAIDKELKKELQRQQRIFQEAESRIALATESRNKLEAALSDPGVYSDKDKFSATETEYKKANAELEKLNKDYEKIFEKIMELEEKINA
ncbi:MAG: ABC transporter ATP-binding protein, partial [Chitinophagaceae bacterium]|nr:ABC transporter ATP-binding protein [Chitinophagaceae bacterium]